MWYNTVMQAILRSPLHGMLSGNTLLLSCQGRRSGRLYTLPVNYVRSDDRLWITSARDRTWWRNLRGGAAVTVRLKGRDCPAHAVAFEDEAGVVDGLTAYLTAAPRMARYFGVSLGGDGRPMPEDIRRIAPGRVVVRVDLLPEEQGG
ncbi:MAG: nitroreductase/quinone reductase family protein [Anaerolineae bacterium]